MPDEGSTPGLRDVVALDAARLAAEAEEGAWGAPVDERVEARAMELWAHVEDLLGHPHPWPTVGAHVRATYRREARRELGLTEEPTP